MKTLRVRAGVLATVTGLVLLGAGITTAQATSPPDHKVTLCHRTGSVAGGNMHNGYSIITVDIASVANAKDARGHDSHNQIGNGPGGDIIPVYTYETFTYPGKNLGAGGAEFLANGCKSVTVAPSTTTTTPATKTTSTTTKSPVSVLGTSATAVPTKSPVGTSTTAVPTESPVSVLGTSATANPLPAAAPAGLADTSGQVIAGSLAAFAALLLLGSAFLLRRRHGVV